MSYEILDLDTNLNYKLNDISSLNNCVINNNITNIKILKTPNFINDDFLSYCTNLKNIDLRPFSNNVTEIGHCFLEKCHKLESIDLSGLSNVTKIGGWFLMNCSNLTNIDLSPFSNVTEIGSWFLYGCHHLKSIDLSPLSNVTKIRDYCLYNCYNLKSINSRGLEWFYHEKKEEYQINYDEMIYDEMLPRRKEFMKEYGLAWELMAAVWHPDNFHKFKYLDPDIFADI